MKKLTFTLAAIAMAAPVYAVPVPAPNATKPVIESTAGLITCQPPLTRHCLGWGRTVFCRCY